MKTTQTLTVEAANCQPKVKQLLIKGIVFLTSKKFAIFVMAISSIISYVAAIMELYILTAYGAMLFIGGYCLTTFREMARDNRQARLGIQKRY